MKKNCLLFVILLFLPLSACKENEDINSTRHDDRAEYTLKEETTINLSNMQSLLEYQIGFINDTENGSKYDYMEPIIQNKFEFFSINNAVNAPVTNTEKIYINAYFINKGLIVSRDLRFDKETNKVENYGVCIISNDNEKKRICVDENCRNHLDIKCTHMQIFDTVNMFSCVYINNNLYFPIYIKYLAYYL